MKFPDKGGYAIVTFFAIAASVILVCIMLFSKPIEHTERDGGDEMNTAPGEENPVELDDISVATLLAEHMSKVIPVKNLTAHITEEGSVQLSADIAARELLEVLKENQVELQGAMRLITRLLPETVKVEMELKIGIDSENSGIYLAPEMIKVGGMELAPALFSEGMRAKYNDGINGYFTEQGISIGSILTEEGRLVIMPKPAAR